MLSIFTQYNALSFLLLQLTMAIIFIYHGWPKLSKPAGMVAGMGWSPLVVRVLGAVEILGGLGILLGAYSQLSALVLALIMLGAIYIKISKWHIPFFSQTNTGWEFDFILLAVSLFLLTNSG